MKANESKSEYFWLKNEKISMDLQEKWSQNFILTNINLALRTLCDIIPTIKSTMLFVIYQRSFEELYSVND